MNAHIESVNGFMEENGGGSDSDSSTDELPEYYQPISAGEGVDDDDLSDRSSEEDSGFHRLPNGYANCVENRISSLDLSDDEDEKVNEEEEEAAAEETTGDASDSAIRSAYREDDSRRTAPLTPENATRVMEAMRGISFGGLAPDWADQVPEDQWINHLRRLRQSPSQLQD